MRRSKSTGPEEVNVLPSLYHEQHSLSRAVKQKRKLTSSYSKAIKKANICVHRSVSTCSEELHILPYFQPHQIIRAGMQTMRLVKNHHNLFIGGRLLTLIRNLTRRTKGNKSIRPRVVTSIHDSSVSNDSDNRSANHSPSSPTIYSKSH